MKSKLPWIERFIQKARIIEVRKFDPVVRVVDAGPLPPDNSEVLKNLIKKAALRELRKMQYEAQRKAS